MTELLVVGGLTAGAALGFSTMLKNQSSAVKGIFVKVEVQNIQNTIADLMRNEANCVATVRNVSATPPSMSSPISIPAIMQYREVSPGNFQTIPFYETGKTYDGVKITSMELRPFRPSQDQTPAHKLEIKYQVTAKIVGPNSFAKKMEFFFNSAPSSFFPSYAFRCAVGGGVLQVAQVRIRDRTTPLNVNCGGFRNVDLSCQPGETPIGCSVQNTRNQDNEDDNNCFVNVGSQVCTFALDQSGDGCDSDIGHCYCSY